MSAEHHISLEDLLEVIPRNELMRIVARRGKVSAAAFVEALHSDLDDAIERLEAAAHQYASDGVAKLTGFLVVQLASVGYNAICEPSSPDHADLKIENHAARVVWMAGANLYRSCAQNIAGILRLFARASGRHAHAGFLCFIRERDAAQIIESWLQALQGDHRMACHGVARGKAACVFTSDHTHPSSMFPITVRHHAVLMGRTSPHVELPPPRQKHTILFLAANPGGTDRLLLDREARAIQIELERAGHRDCFELVTRWAVEPLDLLRELRKLKPTVVHFSGHGGQRVTGEHPPSEGLFFQGADGHAQVVSAAALEETFGAAGASVKLVILNACYTEAQAEALLAHVGCVVGMGGSIRDDAARSFAIGFYGGLGERESIAAAYKQGRAAISLEGLRDGDRPQLKVRAGVDAGRLVLATDPR